MEHEEFIRSGSSTMTTVNGAFVVELSVRPCGLPLALTLFSLHRPVRLVHATQVICCGCDAAAEPRQLPVSKVKTWLLKYDAAHLEEALHRQGETFVAFQDGNQGLTSKTVQSPRRASHSRATCTRRDRTADGSPGLLHGEN